MNTKGNTLEEVSSRITKAILSEPFINEVELVPRIRTIIKAWIKVVDIHNCDNLKLARMITAREIESEFWKQKMRENYNQDKMNEAYKEIDNLLNSQGLKL